MCPFKSNYKMTIYVFSSQSVVEIVSSAELCVVITSLVTPTLLTIMTLVTFLWAWDIRSRQTHGTVFVAVSVVSALVGQVSSTWHHDRAVIFTWILLDPTHGTFGAACKWAVLSILFMFTFGLITFSL